jgi:hypothetical protein
MFSEIEDASFCLACTRPDLNTAIHCTYDQLSRYIHNLVKYEFDFQFEIPATYPATAPEIVLPELDGKTSKMYRGGKV